LRNGWKPLSISYSKPLALIQADLAFLGKFDTVIYGSWLSPNYIPSRSDIDIAIISHRSATQENLTVWDQICEMHKPPYEIRVFELLPLTIQHEIITQYQIVFGDPLNLSGYFYEYHKKWRDCAVRIQESRLTTVKEEQAGLKRRKHFAAIHQDLF